LNNNSFTKDLRSGRKEHESALELLPWYVNETLKARELTAVLKHLAHCELCQVERDRLYALENLVQDEDTPSNDVSLSLRRTLRRIETSEKNRESVQGFEFRHHYQKRKWIAAGLAAVLFIAVRLVNQFDIGPLGDEYQTLSSGIPIEGADRQMELGFAQPIPATALRQALIETRSNIVSGPDEGGRYIVEVKVPFGTSSGEFLSGIKTIEGVEFARFMER
jgi:hypothetical protein